MKKETILFIVLFIVITLFSFLLGKQVHDNKELKNNQSNLMSILKEDTLLRKENDSLRNRYFRDSVNFAQKIRDTNIVRIKYLILEEGLDKMSVDQKISYFYSRFENKVPDSIEFKGDSVVIPNELVGKADSLFLERDFYKEKSDTLIVAINIAKLALNSQLDISKNKEEIINNQVSKINALNKELLIVNEDRDNISKKLKRNRKIAIISTTGLISLTSLLILL